MAVDHALPRIPNTSLPPDSKPILRIDDYFALGRIYESGLVPDPELRS